MIKPPVIEYEKGEYLTLEKVSYSWSKGSMKFTIIVPKNMNTDLSSRPGFAQRLGFEKDGNGRRAYIIHDFLYYVIEFYGGVMPPGTYVNELGEPILSVWSRADADALFKKIMDEDNVKPVISKVTWGAVRLFGGFHLLLGKFRRFFF